MSSLLTVNDVCGRALRMIGAWAIRSPSPRPEEMEEARFWLDMTVGHIAARKRTWWLVPVTGTFNLTAGVDLYDLNAMLTTDQAPNGIEFVAAVFLDDVTDPTNIITLGEVDIERRLDFEALRNLQETGFPRKCTIDRSGKPSMTVHPIPDDARTYRVRIIFQSFPQNMRVKPGTVQLSQVRQSWNLCMVTQLAAVIANGPVRKLPADEVATLQKNARDLLFDLESYDDQEQADEPRQVKYFNGV